VDAHESNETELVILVTPYLVRPADQSRLFRPPDRLKLRRAAAAKDEG
jgi:Flp pilus assembly secretin CpaC